MGFFMKYALLYSSCIISFIALSSAGQAKTLNYNAKLSGHHEIPMNTSHGEGRLKASFDTTSRLLSWNITYGGLTGPATMAHFHGPASVKENADVIIPISKNKLASPITGAIKLTTAQAKQLRAGLWYFNVHSAKFPGGELRTQLKAQ